MVKKLSKKAYENMIPNKTEYASMVKMWGKAEADARMARQRVRRAEYDLTIQAEKVAKMKKKYK